MHKVLPETYDLVVVGSGKSTSASDLGRSPILSFLQDGSD
jgi:hypothetical protein